MSMLNGCRVHMHDYVNIEGIGTTHSKQSSVIHGSEKNIIFLNDEYYDVKSTLYLIDYFNKYSSA